MSADISSAVLTAAAGCCARGLAYARIHHGLPTPDLNEGRQRVAWTVATIQAWRPDVAARCVAIQKTLDKHPLKSPIKRRK